MKSKTKKALTGAAVGLCLAKTQAFAGETILRMNHYDPRVPIELVNYCQMQAEAGEEAAESINVGMTRDDLLAPVDNSDVLRNNPGARADYHRTIEVVMSMPRPVDTTEAYNRSWDACTYAMMKLTGSVK